MDENYWQAINTLAQSVQAGAGMISASDLSSKNRDFYEKQYAIQRKYNTQERLAAQNYNTQERQAVQSWNEMMWERQNDYSSPSAQMQRMMAAGINPNNAALAIGSSGAASVNGVSPASSPSASVSAPSMPQQFNPAQAYAEMYNSYTMALEQRSQARLNEAVAQKTEEETVGLTIDNKFKPFQNEADLQNARQKVELMVSEGFLNEAQATNLVNTFELFKAKTVEEINLLSQQAAHYQESILEIRSNIALMKERINTEIAHQNSLDAAAKEAYENAEAHHSVKLLNGKQGSLVDANKELADLESQDREKQNVYREYLRSHGIDPDHPSEKTNILTNILTGNGITEDIKTGVSILRAGWSVLKNYVSSDSLKANSLENRNIWQQKYGKDK